MGLEFRALELGGEVGELLNVVKKLVREKKGAVGSRSSLAALAQELADVVICADLLAMEVGIDLEQAVQLKFNQTSEKHGLGVQLHNEPDEPRYTTQEVYSACYPSGGVAGNTIGFSEQETVMLAGVCNGTPGGSKEQLELIGWTFHKATVLIGERV